MDFEVVNVTDKKTIKCPSCGETLKVPPPEHSAKESSSIYRTLSSRESGRKRRFLLMFMSF